MLRKWNIVLLLGVCLCMEGAAWAAPHMAPVEQAVSTNSEDNEEAEAMSESVSGLAHQVKHIVDMDFSSQINELQEKVKRLQTLLDSQRQALQRFKQQEMAHYAAFHQQLAQVQAWPTSQHALKKGNLSVAHHDHMAMHDATEYQSALRLVLNKEYKKAQHAFGAYLNHYGRGLYVAEAHYWLGEISMVQHKLQSALSHFLTVVHRFPQSKKIAAAHLKLGLVYADIGKIVEAKRELMLVKKENRGTVVAQLASIRLQQLESIGLQH